MKDSCIDLKLTDITIIQIDSWIIMLAARKLDKDVIRQKDRIRKTDIDREMHNEKYSDNEID